MTDKIKRIGSKAEVFHGSALATPGGLRKNQLMKTKKGRIVSKKQHSSGLKAIKRLFAAGYKPKKGTFKLFRKTKSTKSASRRVVRCFRGRARLGAGRARRASGASRRW